MKATEIFFGKFKKYYNEELLEGSPMGPTRVESAPLGRAPESYRRLGTPLTSSPSPTGVFWSKKNHCESFIPFGLRLLFLFSETLK